MDVRVRARKENEEVGKSRVKKTLTKGTKCFGSPGTIECISTSPSVSFTISDDEDDVVVIRCPAAARLEVRFIFSLFFFFSFERETRERNCKNLVETEFFLYYL